MAQLLVDPGFPLGADRRLVEQPLDGADSDRFGTDLTLRQPSIFVLGKDYGRRLVVLHKMHWSVAQAIFYGGHAAALELGGGEGVRGLLQLVSELVLIILELVPLVAGEFIKARQLPSAMGA